MTSGNSQENAGHRHRDTRHADLYGARLQVSKRAPERMDAFWERPTDTDDGRVAAAQLSANKKALITCVAEPYQALNDVGSAPGPNAVGD